MQEIFQLWPKNRLIGPVRDEAEVGANPEEDDAVNIPQAMVIVPDDKAAKVTTCSEQRL